MSSHFVDIEDKDGQVVDRVYYCSDACAQFNPNYAGWNGCHEIETDEVCGECDTVIKADN